MIEFDNVGMRYGMGVEVLKDIRFQLARGSFHFLVGPSGAGKTSLLKLLYLAHRPSRGLVHFFGKDLSKLSRTELPKQRRRIGVVFQDFRLFDHLTAFENVALPLQIKGAKKSQITDHVEELLTWVGLKDRIGARPATLSGGEQQRVAIARAVINKPDLLVADEPTGNVDPAMADRLMHLFLELNKLGTTTVIATHDEHMVRRMGHDILRLNKGELTLEKKSKAALPLGAATHSLSPHQASGQVGSQTDTPAGTLASSQAGTASSPAARHIEKLISDPTRPFGQTSSEFSTKRGENTGD